MKIRESTKHYLTQMLHAIIEIIEIYQVLAKRKVEYFSNRPRIYFIVGILT